MLEKMSKFKVFHELRPERYSKGMMRMDRTPTEPNDTRLTKWLKTCYSLLLYNTIVVPSSKALLASGPGPSTSQPMSPGPQLLEYMSM